VLEFFFFVAEGKLEIICDNEIEDTENDLYATFHEEALPILI
jgi:hypothetical protein